MPASYPKGDAERVNRVPPAFGWTDLPGAGRAGDPPSLPAWRDWPAATLVWWRVLWAKPQATQWPQDGSSLWTLAMLHAAMLEAEVPTSIAAEMRQHEDRHGLTPKAMLQLRWRVVGESSAAVPKAAAKRAAKRRGAALKVLEGGGAVSA